MIQEQVIEICREIRHSSEKIVEAINKLSEKIDSLQESQVKEVKTRKKNASNKDSV